MLLALLLALSACGGPSGPEPDEDQDMEQNNEQIVPEEPETPPAPEEPPEDPPQEEENDDPSEEEPPEEEPPVEQLPEEETGSPEENDPAPSNPAPAVAGNGYSEENLDQTVANVLASIITDDMTKLQKARAIYDYTRTKIRYTGDSDKSDWKQGAYEGLSAKKGDCFTYYAVARALLTAAGIDNLEVTRVGGISSHWWNLVNCGDGWYHFDATPRSSQMPAFDSFMFTDAQAAEYTEATGKREYYAFDGSLLPARAGSEDAAPASDEPAPAPAQTEDPAPAASDEPPMPELPPDEGEAAAEDIPEWLADSAA